MPIWAAVMNRAVQRLRQGALAVADGATPRGPHAEAGRAAAATNVDEEEQAAAPAAGSAGVEQPWDCDVHLPAWVSANEAHSIRLLLDGWVDSLLEVCLLQRE